MKKAKFLAMLLFAFVCCINLTSCDDDDDDNSTSIVGTWEHSYKGYGEDWKETLKLKKDKTYTFKYVDYTDHDEDMDISGEYIYNEERATLTLEFQGYYINYTNVDVDGKTLTMRDSDGDYIEFHRK